MALKEISARLADRAAGRAFDIARDTTSDREYNRKMRQAGEFIDYRNEKLGINKGNRVSFPGRGLEMMVLKNRFGDVLTKPCRTIEELEAEYEKYKKNLTNESKNNKMKVNEKQLRKLIRESVAEAVNELTTKTIGNVVGKHYGRTEQVSNVVKMFLDDVKNNYQFNVTNQRGTYIITVGDDKLDQIYIIDSKDENRYSIYIVAEEEGNEFEYHGIGEYETKYILRNMRAGERTKFKKLVDVLYDACYSAQEGILNRNN